MQRSAYEDFFGVRSSLKAGGKEYQYFSIAELGKKLGKDITRLPYSIRVLLESVLRNVNEQEVTKDHVESFLTYNPADPADIEIPYTPARVLLQDFTGVPCVVDLAAMRSAMERMGGDPEKINPKLPVNLVIDHSVNTDFFGTSEAFKQNMDLEFHRNKERYEFLRWGQAALENFHVVPPASGICHQVNLEYLGKVVQTVTTPEGDVAYFDTLVGTDSHTTMINGLGILGWGVGGIEAEAAMLGQPIYMLAPPVVGVRLRGSLRAGITATDLVLRVTQMLREHGVVGKIVEFFGPGMGALTVPDRATLANMAPEYGATAGFFPPDKKTLEYMYATGRDEDLLELVETYTRAQGIFGDESNPEPEYQAVLDLDLATVEASIAGPKRPQDRISLQDVPKTLKTIYKAPIKERGYALQDGDLQKSALIKDPSGKEYELHQGDVVIASITSCTNTSNPSVLIGAGLVAKKAAERGLRVKPYVKTSFAPGSVVVTEYLEKAGLMPYLNQLGFNLVGYGCMTCIGNSGPLPEHIAQAVEKEDLVVGAVLSGNRNFEGRVNPHTKINFLASPPLCVAYAIAGTMHINLHEDAIGTDTDGKPVYMRDIWPSEEELARYVSKALDREAFKKSYGGIEKSNPRWNDIPLQATKVYPWNEESTYIQEPPFFVGMGLETQAISPIGNARVLVKVGDSITTDHISPAGSIAYDSPAGTYLAEKGVSRPDFNSYGSRRGNDRIMTRGTFANIRLRNQMAPGTEGSWTRHQPSGDQISIYEASQRYKTQQVPTIVLAGKDYGMGSSRDWAAKGVQLLGVQAVIAESFERIHRSNLVGMGVLPLQFKPGESAESLGLKGDEEYTITVDDGVQPKQEIRVSVRRPDGSTLEFGVICRIDSSVEVDYYRNGGILHTVLRRMVAESRA
ncbi:aconitate hydratase AcnA [Spirochaeta lutea]|uniref:Aconitate hydratase n=1 Tax=Spirochaeta lutea TaxID=1480694 RepID=A0A098QVH9_9SPIO|nr:aconitate hydratase AcnA [Spirochaeta lutea]KGE71393.1 aconitate hydratase [Spirochaeta lutea]